MPATPLRPAVVLVRPQEEGNVGAVARVMANTGLDRLAVVEPGAPFGDVALARAVGARHLLMTAERAPDLPSAVADLGFLVGTTSSRGRSLPAQIVEPRDLAARLAALPAGTPTGLVFGPEASGLTSEELARCGLLVRIPTDPGQPTLNLSHAVLVLAYELLLARAAPAPPAASEAEPPAPAGEVAGLVDHVDRLLRRAGFARDDTYDGVLRDLAQLAARAAPTRREVRIARGICRRLLARLDG